MKIGIGLPNQVRDVRPVIIPNGRPRRSGPVLDAGHYRPRRVPGLDDLNEVRRLAETVL